MFDLLLDLLSAWLSRSSQFGCLMALIGTAIVVVLAVTWASL